jgi:hypothetical protein
MANIFHYLSPIMSGKKPTSGDRTSKMQRKSICLDVKLQDLRRLEAGEREVDVGASLTLATSTIITTIKKCRQDKASVTTTSKLLVITVTRSGNHLLKKKGKKA